MAAIVAANCELGNLCGAWVGVGYCVACARYRFDGKEKLLSLGTYPDVSLAKAREKRDEAPRLVADGIDPSGQTRRCTGPKRRAAIQFSFVIRRFEGRAG